MHAINKSENTHPTLLIELYAFPSIPSPRRPPVGLHSSPWLFPCPRPPLASILKSVLNSASTPGAFTHRLNNNNTQVDKAQQQARADNDQSEKCILCIFCLFFQKNPRALTPEPSSTVPGPSGCVCHHPPDIQYPSSDPLLDSIDPSRVGVARKTLLGQCAAKMWSR